MCSGLDKLWAKRLAVWISCRIIGFSEYFSRRRARITREFSETKELCRDYSKKLDLCCSLQTRLSAVLRRSSTILLVLGSFILQQAFRSFRVDLDRTHMNALDVKGFDIVI